MWEVRKATERDIPEIVELGKCYATRVNPYVLNPTQIKAYLDEWLVAEGEYIIIPPSLIARNIVKIGGSVHITTSEGLMWARNEAYLLHVKLVPPEIVRQFHGSGSVFISHITCPGKGSFRAIIEYLKAIYPEIWCFVSNDSKSPYSYYRDKIGFVFTKDEYTGMNPYKGDYSHYVWGKLKGNDRS